MASEIALCLGIGNTVAIGGRVFELSLFTWRMIALFERWLKNRAWADVEDFHEGVGEDDYRERHGSMTRLAIPDCYEGSSAFEQAWASEEGFAVQAWLRFHRYQPNVTLEQVQGWLYGQHAPDIINRIVEMEQDHLKRKTRQKKPRASPRFRSVCALLAGDPWRRTEQQVGDMTPWQTQEICFHARHQDGDRAGQIVLPEDSGASSAMADALEAFADECRKNGMTDEQMNAAWIAKIEAACTV